MVLFMGTKVGDQSLVIYGMTWQTPSAVGQNYPSQRWDLKCRDTGTCTKAIDLSKRILLVSIGKAG